MDSLALRKRRLLPVIKMAVYPVLLRPPPISPTLRAVSNTRRSFTFGSLLMGDGADSEGSGADKAR